MKKQFRIFHFFNNIFIAIIDNVVGYLNLKTQASKAH